MQRRMLDCQAGLLLILQVQAKSGTGQILDLRDISLDNILLCDMRRGKFTGQISLHNTSKLWPDHQQVRGATNNLSPMLPGRGRLIRQELAKLTVDKTVGCRGTHLVDVSNVPFWRNSINEWPMGAMSPGMESHVHQVTPDRQHATAAKDNTNSRNYPISYEVMTNL